MNKQPARVPVILGPTGVGKTGALLELSRRIPLEAVSADSRQIYRYLSIGTAKPSREILAEVPHHCIDIINPDQVFSSSAFAHRASGLLDRILCRRRLPVVAGGTGFYIKSLFTGLFKGPGRDDDFRRALQASARDREPGYLYNELKKNDPAAAGKIHPHDTMRVIRALEVFHLTGIPVSQLQREHTRPATELQPVYIGLHRERNELYAHINRRTLAMLRSGWIDEVREVLKKGYDPACPGLESIGYRQIVAFLQNQVSREEMTSRIQQLTRNYAKRQIIWFRKMQNVQWVSPDDVEKIYGIISRCSGE